MTELVTAILLDGHDYSNFRTAVGKSMFMAPWRPDMQLIIQQPSTPVLDRTTESKRAVKYRYDISEARDSATPECVVGCSVMYKE